MASLGDAVVQFPISGSYSPPNTHMRVINQAASSSISVLTASLTSQMLLPSNPNRMGLILRNQSPANAYLKYGGGPADSWTFSVLMAANGNLGAANSPAQLYTGEIHVMWDNVSAASGSMKITEFT